MVQVVRDVMVFTPMLRLEPATVKAVMDLKWDGPLTLVFQRDNPTGDKYQDHLHQYQRGREAFLRGPHDAMLVIESDIVPPRDTLLRLAALEADVAYGVYPSRSSGNVNVLELYYGGKPRARNIGEPLTCRDGHLWRAALAKGIVGCSGGGLGVLLIHRKVLEAVPFEACEGWCDNKWTNDVYQAGFTMVADTGVLCGHVCRDGETLWPARTMDEGRWTTTIAPEFS